MKNWENTKRTVTLTNAQWTRLSTYILMTTQYRNAELDAWKSMQKEKNDDGTPVFKNANNNIKFWRNTIKILEEIQKTIDTPWDN